MRGNGEFPGGAGWQEFCASLVGKPFLTGQNDRGWKADFDWCLDPGNIAKVREGKYDRTGQCAARPGKTDWLHTEHQPAEGPIIDMEEAA